MTNDLTIEVLGTIFNVRTRHAETVVDLEEGKVVMISNSQFGERVLAPGDSIRYLQKEGFVKLQKDRTDAASWSNGVMLIEAPLEEVLEKWGEIYGASFTVSDRHCLICKLILV